MQMLLAGVELSVIALWLGHESIETTQVYLDASLPLKERALARVAPAAARGRRYRAKDGLLAFLDAL
jgi:integrase